MGSSSKPKEDPVTTEINMITLARLKREEADLQKNEQERSRILETGRQGRSSLLSFGWAGPGMGQGPIRPLADVRAGERASGPAQAKAAKPVRRTTTPSVSRMIPFYTANRGS